MINVGKFQVRTNWKFEQSRMLTQMITEGQVTSEQDPKANKSMQHRRFLEVVLQPKTKTLKPVSTR